MEKWNDSARQKLCEIITKYGKDVYEKPQWGAGLLLDICAEHPKEKAVLIGALKYGVPDRLQCSKNSVHYTILLSQLSKGLEENLGFGEEGATWAVESWAVALGVISVPNPSQSQTKPPYLEEANPQIDGRENLPTNDLAGRIIDKFCTVLGLIQKGEKEGGSSRKLRMPITLIVLAMVLAGIIFMNKKTAKQKADDNKSIVVGTTTTTTTVVEAAAASDYHARGDAKLSLGQNQEAIADYDRAIELNPAYAIAYHRRGDAKFNLGQNQEAIADYDEVIKLDPTYGYAYYNRGHAKFKLGKNQEAIADYDQAIKLDPTLKEIGFYK